MDWDRVVGRKRGCLSDGGNGEASRSGTWWSTDDEDRIWIRDLVLLVWDGN